MNKKKIKGILRCKYNSISGSLKRRVDDFYDAGSLSKKDCTLLKAQLANVLWESYRDLEKELFYKIYSIYDPNKQK